MTNVVIGRDLLLDGDGKFADIDLMGARVGSSIIFEQSEFRGLVDCTDATIPGRDVLVQEARRVFWGRSSCRVSTSVDRSA